MNTILNDSEKVIISEMSSEAVSGIIHLDPELVSKVVGDDSDPMFVTMPVLSEGVSRNGRYYSEEALREVAHQIDTEHPDGYAGHITKEERSNKVPDCEVIWLGSKLAESEGKLRLFAKGYILPEAKKRRSYMQKAKALGKGVSVSIYGTARQVWDKALKAYRQMNIDLESIDFTRPKSEGVPNGGVFALTAEMVDSKLKEEAMDKAEALKSCTADELREYVPEAVIAEITDEAVAAAKAENVDVIQEMEAKKDAVIAEMRTELRGFELEGELNAKVIDKAARKMIRRIVLSEMADDEKVSDAVDRVLSSEEGKAIVSEMTVVEPKVQPAVEAKAAKATKSHQYIVRREK